MAASITTSSTPLPTSGDSDLALKPQAFDTPYSTPADVRGANAFLTKISTNGPKWYNVGAPTYRDMIERGETVLPKPEYLEDARDAVLPTTADLGHNMDVPLRIYAPKDGPVKGLLIHFHGGGWTIGSHRHSDKRLKLYAERCHLLAISVGYRHAPENPYPAASNDCLAAVRWLLDTIPAIADGTSAKSGPLSGVTFSTPKPPVFLTGESAGATLAMQTILSLFREDALKPSLRHRAAAVTGLVLFYGCYDLGMGLPSHYTTGYSPPYYSSSSSSRDETPGDGDDGFYTSPPVVLPRDVLNAFQEAWVPASCFPRTSPDGRKVKADLVEARRDPRISSLYENLPLLLHRANTTTTTTTTDTGGEVTLTPINLPPALFLCGSFDPLLDDTVLMSMKWRIAAGTSPRETDQHNECFVRVWPGAPHAFDLLDGLAAAEEAMEAAVGFILART